MGKKKGKKTYVPPSVFDELENIKSEVGIGSQAESFRLMAKNSRVGREAKKRGII